MELDHLAVAGETLEAAVSHVEAALGLPMLPGGAHPVFGTHNRLMGLGPGIYLEAIAIDHDAPAPDRPRWFDLDRLSGPAHLRNWIVRVDDLDEAIARQRDAGAPLDLARGALRWRMAVPEDGVLPFDNCFPALIVWQGCEHPADRLPDAGARLKRLVVAHPEASALRAALAHLNDPRIVFEPGPPDLRAEIATPHGTRVLE